MTLAEALAATLQKMEFDHRMQTEARKGDNIASLIMANALLSSRGRPQFDIEKTLSEIEGVVRWHPVAIVREGPSGFGEDGVYRLNAGRARVKLPDGLKLVLADRVLATIQAAGVVKALCVLLKSKGEEGRLAAGLSPSLAAFDTLIDSLMSCRDEGDLVSCLQKGGKILDWGRKQSMKALAEIVNEKGGEDEA